jgi:hypothetical protein
MLPNSCSPGNFITYCRKLRKIHIGNYEKCRRFSFWKSFFQRMASYKKKLTKKVADRPVGQAFLLQPYLQWPEPPL